MAGARRGKNEFKRIQLRMHPRVFAALGADLVTNDVVAVIELVKNSYDAFAQNVWLRFGEDPSLGTFLEIEDDGNGMTREIIEEAWCVVATPFKEQNPVVGRGKKARRVAGEKGLGRLSVARLGDRLHMFTQSPGEPCWEVKVNWTDISAGDDLSSSFVECRQCSKASPFKKSGTLLRIHCQKAHWGDNHVSDLQDNLARLISPFSDKGDFNIFLTGFVDDKAGEVQISSPEFLSWPKYLIKGEADSEGKVTGVYKFRSIIDGAKRNSKVNLSWEQIYSRIADKEKYEFCAEKAHCGPFSFEIRAWDISGGDTQEISERFDFQKSLIREAIRVHKGITVYRDRILVLPKSENARDWFGLDLRRVSKVGTRLATNQVVGFISISAKDNPGIQDTSDRERLAACLEVGEFEEIIKAVIGILENERDQDRIKIDIEKPMDDLFEGLSAEELVAEVIALSEEGADAAEAVPLLRAFSSSLDTARKTIQERFVFYSRLATVGTIAQMLVHEIRNRTTAFGSFLDFIKSRFGPFKDREIEQAYRRTDNAVNALERLADTFAPLASRSFRRRKRQSVLETQIRECLSLLEAEIKSKKVKCTVPISETIVAVDPGELDAIILNLITNALYWMAETSKENRELVFHLTPISEGSRMRVWVHDTGPGIDLGDEKKVFWPGVTRKPGGIGMGLTVASELVAIYGGRMTAKHPGTKGGASFAFDLPLRK
ncbi:MAG: ATP-binding protein [Spirochaetales bacterium]|nr:ATP-binding protein [Spirochaetales bacterium]